MSGLIKLLMLNDVERLVAGLQDGTLSPDESDENLVPAISVAVTLGFNECALELLRFNANAELRDPDGDSALHYAAAVNNGSAITSLVKVFLTVDPENDLGKTPLIVAAAMGHVQACRVLIDSGAEVNHLDTQRRSALHWAAMRNDDPGLISFLLNAGADQELLDHQGKRALDLARLVNHHAVIQVLVQNERAP